MGQKMDKERQQYWIDRFTHDLDELESLPDPTEFDKIMMQAIRSQIITLKVELAKEELNERNSQTHTEKA